MNFFYIVFQSTFKQTLKNRQNMEERHQMFFVFFGVVKELLLTSRLVSTVTLVGGDK